MPVVSGPSPAYTVPSIATTTLAPAPVAAAPALQRDDVQRTLAIVVDDLGLSWESMFGLPKALHTFVDRDLRPTDLVALVRTAGTGGGLQPFTTDRRVLHSLIDGLRWNGNSRNAVVPFE